MDLGERGSSLVREAAALVKVLVAEGFAVLERFEGFALLVEPLVAEGRANVLKNLLAKMELRKGLRALLRGLQLQELVQAIQPRARALRVLREQQEQVPLVERAVHSADGAVQTVQQQPIQQAFAHSVQLTSSEQTQILAQAQ